MLDGGDGPRQQTDKGAERERKRTGGEYKQGMGLLFCWPHTRLCVCLFIWLEGGAGVRELLVVVAGRNGGHRCRHCGSQTIALWLSLVAANASFNVCVCMCGQGGLAVVAAITDPRPTTTNWILLSHPRLHPPPSPNHHHHH